MDMDDGVVAGPDDGAGDGPAAHADPDRSRPATRYLALDTNVLVAYLGVVRAVHGVLSTTPGAAGALLVPSIVVHELDGLAASTTPNKDGRTVGDAARAATAWLLRVHRQQRLAASASASRAGAGTGMGAGAGADATTTPPRAGRGRLCGAKNDQVLDCCLYFRARTEGATVALWTDDRNLSLLAEANDVPIVFGPHVPPLLRALGLEERELDVDAIDVDAELDDADADGGMGMELDRDLVDDPLHDTRAPVKSSVDDWLVPLIPPSRRSPTNARPPVPAHVLSVLLALVAPLSAALAPASPASSAPACLRNMIDALSAARAPVPVETARALARAHGACRTLLHRVEPPPGAERRPRAGEAGDALRALAGAMDALGVAVGDADEWKAVEDALRAG
ncbi:hypothetical protein Q5752_003458 [Cryptotrichosporon argae]